MAIYLRNKDLYMELKVCKNRGKLSNELVVMFQLVAKNVLRKKYYVDPQDKEDAYSSAIEDMCRFYHNFDDELYDNAFAYITEVAKRGMAKSWNKMYNPHSLPEGAKIMSISNLQI